MNLKKERFHIKVRIPFFLFSLGFSIYASKLLSVMTKNDNLQQLFYPLLVILLIYLAEKTRLSNKTIHVALAVLIVIAGFGMEMLAEPTDALWIRSIIS